MLAQEEERFAIRIKMSGDVDLTLYYKHKGISLFDAEVTQDFTNVYGTRPTLYLRKENAEFQAAAIRSKLVDIRDELKSHGYHRNFDVAVVIY